MTAPQQQKIKSTGRLVITANRLGDGKVVYRTTEGEWTTDLERAAEVSPATAKDILAVAREEFRQIVDPYAAPVLTAEGGGLVPANLRETIRKYGPTIQFGQD
jgi:Protein of unknown function (DUF2849)